MMKEREWTGSEKIPLGPSGAIAAAEWTLKRLADLGVELPPENRLVQAKRLLEEVNEERPVLSPNDALLLRRVTEAQWTIYEQHIIARATSTRSGKLADEHRRKLEMMLGGADIPERDSNPLARNTQFELYTAATLAMGGAVVAIGEPDLRLLLAGEDFGIAAKRVQSVKQIRKRVRGAIDQIRKSGGRGIIAVNADLLLMNTGLPGSVSDRGAAFDERLEELHRLDEELVNEPMVFGRIALGHDAIWNFGGERPALEMAMFRQYRFFPNTDEEERQVREFVDQIETMIETRMNTL